MLTQALEQCPVSGMRLVRVKGSTFQMGDWNGDGFENEQPLHSVTLDDFWIGQTPVTQGQWQKVMGNNPSYFARGEDYPVERVNYQDIQEFLQRLNQLTHLNYTLPSEAQWEYAARSGGRMENWSGTNEESLVGEYGWFDENATFTTHAVGQRRPNSLGLFDMSGNVFEMVADTYAPDAYRYHQEKNPVYQVEGGERVLRGGSWYSYRLLLRCTDRSIYGANCRDRYVGFRVARNI
ncbi:MAG: formylglycine-generating enzyme family protein [Magnetococcales bacterium]|nr:formylglycine-generating enzyme family protein [Magnetococcales bacterium]